MLIIDKQLDRSDGTPVVTGSLVIGNQKQDERNKIIRWEIEHFLDQDSIDSGKDTIRGGVLNFKIGQSKKCTEQQWDEITKSANSGALLETWLMDILNEIIGQGTVKKV